MELKTWKNYDKIIIYGAGDIATRILEWFIYKKLDHRVACIVVSDTKKNPSNVYGIPVLDVKEQLEKSDDELVLVATTEDKHEEIGNYLQALGFKNVDYVTKETYNYWNRENEYLRFIAPCNHVIKQFCVENGTAKEEQENYIRQTMQEMRDEQIVNLSRLVAVLGTKCSLRCKECNNLIPHFKPQEDIEAETIIASLENLLSKVRTLYVCELIGGEPFLSKSLLQVLEYLQGKENVKQIEITTNGMIVPDETFSMALQSEKVKVRISNYGDVVNPQRLIEYLERHQIRYQMLKLEQWISPGDQQKRGNNRAELHQYYTNCVSGYLCKTLFKDKIFACARAASLYELGYMKEEEYLSIDENLTADAVKTFLLRRYSEACDYCDMACENKKIIPIAEQI